MKSTTLIPFYLKFILLFSLVSAIVNNSLMRLRNLRRVEKPVSENYIILKYKSLVTLNGQFLNVSEEKPVSHYAFNKALCRKYGWDDSCIVANEEKENIYYLDNSLRKRILKTRIGWL